MTSNSQQQDRLIEARRQAGLGQELEVNCYKILQSQGSPNWVELRQSFLGHRRSNGKCFRAVR